MSDTAIRFVRLDSEYAQCDWRSVNRGLAVLDLPVSHVSLCMFINIYIIVLGHLANSSANGRNKNEYTNMRN